MYIVGAIHSCTEEEREDNICKRTIVFFAEEKKTEKIQEGYIWRRKIFNAEERKNGEGKGR